MITFFKVPIAFKVQYLEKNVKVVATTGNYNHLAIDNNSN